MEMILRRRSGTMAEDKEERPRDILLGLDGKSGQTLHLRLLLSQGTAEDNQLAASSSLRIILVGKSGSGKSATGNSILLRKEFKSQFSALPVTTKCQEATCTWNGRSILVVDTPPIFEAQTPTPETYRDIADCYLLSAPGPHVLLLVTQLGHFTAQDSEAVRRVQEVFGEGALRHMVILFTHVEDLMDETLEEYVAGTDNARLRRLVQECGRRYYGFNNRASREEQRAQLEGLMGVLERQERELRSAFLSRQLSGELMQWSSGSAGSAQRLFRVFSCMTSHLKLSVFLTLLILAVIIIYIKN